MPSKVPPSLVFITPEAATQNTKRSPDRARSPTPAAGHRADACALSEVSIEEAIFSPGAGTAAAGPPRRTASAQRACLPPERPAGGRQETVVAIETHDVRHGRPAEMEK
jgi:hypothetical protein